MDCTCRSGLVEDLITSSVALDACDSVHRSAQELPRFEDGRVNYSAAALAPVITCYIRAGDHLLLLKRSDRVSTYQGLWHTVAGYLDEPRPIVQKVLEELDQEIGVEPAAITSAFLGSPQRQEDAALGRIWVVHPVLVTLRTQPAIRLDWEHTDFRWVLPSDLGSYQTLPRFAAQLRLLEEEAAEWYS